MGVLVKIQSELKAPKGQYNSFGKYSYRSCEDILEALKPLLFKHEAELYLSDEVVQVGDRVYVKATATFTSKDEMRSISAYAREPKEKKGMDEAQITGTASSYARKYALNGLFLIDDSKDADTDEYRATEERKPAANRTDKEAPKQGAIRFTHAETEEMRKWGDGTFTEKELSDIRAGLKGADFRKVFENAKNEYMDRKVKEEESKMGGDIY